MMCSEREDELIREVVGNQQRTHGEQFEELLETQLYIV